jgi:hypothetical protein
MQANRLTPVLACEDRMLRVLDRSSVLHNIEVDAIPTVLHLNGNDGGEAGDEILYGTADGRVGLVRVGRSVLFILVLRSVTVKILMNVSIHVYPSKVLVPKLVSISCSSFPHLLILGSSIMCMVVSWTSFLCLQFLCCSKYLSDSNCS